MRHLRESYGRRVYCNGKEIADLELDKITIPINNLLYYMERNNLPPVLQKEKLCSCCRTKFVNKIRKFMV